MRMRALLALAPLLAVPVAAHAYFEQVEVGSRAISMGRAFVASADDASALYWNPAGLARLSRRVAMLDYTRLYAVEDLSAGFVALAWPLELGTVAAGWNHQAVTDVVSEDLFYASLSRSSSVGGGSWRVHTGATLKAARVGYAENDEADYGSITRITGDAGVIVEGPRVRLGYALRNIVEPEFDFVSGGGGTSLPRQFDAGVTYQWHADSKLVAGIGSNREDGVEARLGGEVVFYEVLFVRAGVSGSRFTGGIGLEARRWRLDSAFVTHSNLGVSYRVTLSIPFGPPVSKAREEEP